MKSRPPSLSLDEARRRLRELGYLDGRVERFVFRRALAGRGGLFLPAVLLGDFSATLAAVAAVESAEPGFGQSPGSVTALLIHLFAAFLLPAALLGLVLAQAADRSRAPSRAATLAGLVAAGLVLTLWVAGSYGLGGLSLHALVWGVPVSATALLLARSVRSGLLARVYAHSGRLPERPRSKVFLAAAVLGMLVAAAIFALRRPLEPVRPPQPTPQREQVVVIAVDGLQLDAADSGASSRLRALLARGATGWWPAEKASPPEIWMNLATGVPASRHGVRALARVRPLGSSLALRPPFGSAWYLAGVGNILGTVSSAPVSARDRESLTFWEIHASTGLSAVSVGWWSSGPWPGATVVENEEILSLASSGADVDRVAIERLSEARKLSGDTLQTVYLPSLDILRKDRTLRSEALARIENHLEEEVRRAEASVPARVLIVLAGDSHPRPSALGRMIVFDGRPRPQGIRIRPQDVAPSLLARAGVPVARDLPGRPVAALFRPGSLETATVETYGPRVAPRSRQFAASDRQYLEKLKSLGYLN